MKKLLVFLPVCFMIICSLSCSEDDNPLEPEREYPYSEIVSMDEDFITSCEVSFIGEDSVHFVITGNSELEPLHVEAFIKNTPEEPDIAWISDMIPSTTYLEFENDKIEFGYKYNYDANLVKFNFTKWGDGYDITIVLEVIATFKNPYLFNLPFYF